MHLLYLDDSGSVADKSVNYVVLGGVCVAENNLRWLSYEIERFALELNPDNPESVEFHAAEIFQGKEEPWKSMSKVDRVDAICRTLRTLKSGFDTITVFAVAVEKRPFGRDPMLEAYERISQLFNNHLERDFKNPELGMILLDDTSYKTGLQGLAAEIRKTGNKKGSQNRCIVEIPVFVDSKVSRLVQLADHIAYGVFRKYNAYDTKYFSEFEGRFIFKDSSCYSLLHLTSNPDCTCPACLTKKRNLKQENES